VRPSTSIIRSDMGAPSSGTRARKPGVAQSYSRAIEGTYDGPWRRVKLGHPWPGAKMTV